MAEQRKNNKYSAMAETQNARFLPFAVEMYGGLGKSAKKLLNKISKCARNLHVNVAISSNYTELERRDCYFYSKGKCDSNTVLAFTTEQLVNLLSCTWEEVMQLHKSTPHIT